MKTLLEKENESLTSYLDEIVLNHESKLEWEQLRIQNLSNPDVVTILVKCSKCEQIYAFSFDLHKDSFYDMVCKFCENNGIIPYDFENETPAEYTRLLSSFVLKR